LNGIDLKEEGCESSRESRNQDILLLSNRPLLPCTATLALYYLGTLPAMRDAGEDPDGLLARYHIA
jgi:hypothetical protein